MSHFSVVVALPADTEDIGAALTALLEPFDENKEVESYEEDGRWMAPGRMGWFGISDDDPDSYAYYVREANTYIDSLPQDAFLVVLDCHI